MTDADSKKSSKILSSCGCENAKGKELIVITIETCCRKTCDGTQRAKSAVPGPKVPGEPSKPQIKDSKSSQPKSVRSTPLIPPSDSEDELTPPPVAKPSPEPPSKKISHSGDGKTTEEATTSESSEDSIPPVRPPTPEKKSPAKGDKVQRIFKLPLVTERHHGPGCAMEITVLEKHEDSCMYKKKDTKGRTIDDRVGSYDCIGRLVFRTCNPSELETDSSGSQGITGDFTGLSPTEISKAGGGGKPTPNPSTPSPEPPRSTRSQPAPTPPPPQKDVKPSPPPPQKDVKPSPPPPKKDVNPSPPPPAEVAKPTPPPKEPPLPKSGEIKPPKDKKEKTPVEPVVKPTTLPPSKDIESVSASAGEQGKSEIKPIPEETVGSTGQKKLEYQVMHVSTRNEKVHFPGDDCKLHHPKSPLLLSPQFERALASKKTFPMFVDEGNQTEPMSDSDGRTSLQTISTLTDLRETQNHSRKKPSFLGAIFKRGSDQSSKSKLKKRGL